MPVCSSGTSGPRTGVPSSVVVDQAYVQSLLPPALAWLYPYLPWMHGLQIGDVGAFCAVDPPTFSVPTGPEIFDFVTNGNFANVALVQQFIQDITRVYLWYNLCQCNAVTTPAAPAAPSAPANLPAVNPTGIVGIPSASCGSQSATATVDWSVHPVKEVFSNTYYGYTGGPAASTLITPMSVSHPLQAQVTWAVSPAGTEQTGSFDNNIDLTWFAGTTGLSDVTATILSSGVSSALGAVYQSAIVDVPPTADHIFVQFGVGANAVKTVTVTVNYFCTRGTNVGGSPPVCCTATDPISQSTLNQILQLVTLIQRYVAPFAYVPGATHPGLSGNGTLTIPSCIGVLITLTTVPTSVGVESGSPNELFQAGWVSWGNATAFTERVWVHKNPQLSFPASAQQFTRLGYSLSPGVVATIQELYAET